jgi:hypothetical protein
MTTILFILAAFVVGVIVGVVAPRAVKMLNLRSRRTKATSSTVLTGQTASKVPPDRGILVLLLVVLMLLLSARGTNASERASKEPSTPRLPKFIDYLLHLLPKDEWEPLLGDIEELYPAMHRRYGEWGAKFWYYWQVSTAFRSVLAKVIKWGVMSWLGDVIRRFIS